MNRFKYHIFAVLTMFAALASAQDQQEKKEREPGHYNQSRFKQLNEELPASLFSLNAINPYKTVHPGR